MIIAVLLQCDNIAIPSNPTLIYMYKLVDIWYVFYVK